MSIPAVSHTESAHSSTSRRPRAKIRTGNLFEAVESKSLETALSALATVAQSGVKRAGSFDEPPPKRFAADHNNKPIKSKNPAKLKEIIEPVVQKSLHLTQLSDHEFLQELNTHKSKAPPPAPRKGSAPARRIPLDLPPPSPFRVAFSCIQNGTFSIDNQKIPVKFLSKEGSYMDVYTLTDPVSLITEKFTHDVVIKVFNFTQLSSNERLLVSFMKTSLAYYHAIRGLGLPVATIDNAETAIEDGFYIQERMHQPIDVLNIPHIEQARAFFIAALLNRDILFDLLPSNLMATESGCVKLIDFVEETDDDTDILIEHALEKWCKLYQKECGANREETIDFLMRFTEGFEKCGYDHECTQTVIESLPFDPAK